MSLFASAVSACVCAHHQPPQMNAAVSCHSSAHEETSHSADKDGSGRSLNENCTCPERAPSPFIAARSEHEKSGAQNVTAVLNAANILPTFRVSAARAAAIPDPDEGTYVSGRRDSASPRAPPRL
jgi:hypothetical protein